MLLSLRVGRTLSRVSVEVDAADAKELERAMAAEYPKDSVDALVQQLLKREQSTGRALHFARSTLRHIASTTSFRSLVASEGISKNDPIRLALLRDAQRHLQCHVLLFWMPCSACLLLTGFVCRVCLCEMRSEGP